jgi:hypothetical protein
MPNTERPLRVYEDLANWYDRTGQAKLRDWFLVLAADDAFTRGQAKDAERLRSRLLQTNPHHLLKPFASFKEALKSPDVQGYIADLRRTYPPEAAATLLASQRQAAAEREAHGHGSTARPAGVSPPSTELFPSESEDPYVVRMQPTAEEAKNKASPTAPRPAAAPRPPLHPEQAPGPAARVPAQPRPRGPQRGPSPARGPGPIPLALPPNKAPRSSSPAEPLEESAAGAWVSSGLFMLLLLGSLALAAYTFLGPFLPPGWLR